jgi:hypothetical protein
MAAGTARSHWRTRPAARVWGFLMAEYGLFIGWGSPRTGKEAASYKVFGDAAAYWKGLQAAGEIESVETVLLGYHGGDLGGFFLVRGDPEKLGQLSMSPELNRLSMRAATCLDNVGIVTATIDDGVMRQLAGWKEAIADLI